MVMLIMVMLLQVVCLSRLFLLRHFDFKLSKEILIYVIYGLLYISQGMVEANQVDLVDLDIYISGLYLRVWWKPIKLI
jgi:hypothetical protein